MTQIKYPIRDVYVVSQKATLVDYFLISNKEKLSDKNQEVSREKHTHLAGQSYMLGDSTFPQKPLGFHLPNLTYFSLAL